jgi:predicted RNA-binding protein Jag
MIYLVAFLAVLCGVLAFLLGQKPKVITEVKQIEVISELPTSIPTYRDWLDEDIEVRDRLLTAMESSAMRVSIESSTTTIALDSPDIKGRIIGREGRNLKSFEQITGVELVIDDTENIVTLSSFDPYRREVATQTLKALIKDGKIQFDVDGQIVDASIDRLAGVLLGVLRLQKAAVLMLHPQNER